MEYLTIQIKVKLDHNLFLNTIEQKQEFIQTLINLISKTFLRKTFLRKNNFKIISTIS